MPIALTLGGSAHLILDAACAEIIDQPGGGVVYHCEAEPGADPADPVWRCRKVTTVGGVTRTTWADSGEFTQVADDRATLTYS